jgi:hypothetical protein
VSVLGAELWRMTRVSGAFGRQGRLCSKACRSGCSYAAAGVVLEQSVLTRVASVSGAFCRLGRSWRCSFDTAWVLSLCVLVAGGNAAAPRLQAEKWRTGDGAHGRVPM